MEPFTPSDPFHTLAQRIAPGSTLLRAWPLHGGVSAQVTALLLRHPDGREQRLVVRQHGAHDRARNPHIARDEYILLHHLQKFGIPVPAPLWLDEGGALGGTPCLVIAYVEGEADGSPAAPRVLGEALADELATIHRLDGQDPALAFLPRQATLVGHRLQPPPPSPTPAFDTAAGQRHLAARWPRPARNRPALLHGDFWPGNLIWQGGQVRAVIDWEDAAIGDPLADVANARLELLWAGGSEAMEAFTQHYRAQTALNVSDLPFWDLYAALRLGPPAEGWAPPALLPAMRAALRRFVAQAEAALAATHSADGPSPW